MWTPFRLGRDPGCARVALFACMVACSISCRPDARAVGARTPEHASDRDAPSTLPNLEVIDANGLVRPLQFGPDGGVLAVVSVECGHCRAVLERLAVAANGRRLRSLTVVAMEGARRGQDLADSLGLQADVVGPAIPAREFMDALGVRTVPTLLRVDPDGAILERVGGEIGERDALVWIVGAGRQP